VEERIREKEREKRAARLAELQNRKDA
jgi:hypothetical protein